MFIRSLTVAILMAAAGSAYAAERDSPLEQDRGKARPLIVIAPSTIDPTLVNLQKTLKEPDNQKGFAEREMVLYTVINTIGQRNGKDLDAQATMALIRELKLGASSGTKVILVGKDGEKKLEQQGTIDLKEIFAAIDKMPMMEKSAAAPAPAAPAPEAQPGAAEKPVKGGKSAAKTLDD
jgi:hypothetical protein